MTKEERTPERIRPAMLVIRGVFGGTLMGLANLVPGISGGTMLLASGVYTRFINAIAEVSTFRFRLNSLVLLGSIVCAAMMAILLFAGPVKDLVVEHRWVMYSLFIGLTLGGVPLVWRMAHPLSGGVWGGAVAGFVVMAALALAQGSTPEAPPAWEGGTRYEVGDRVAEEGTVYRSTLAHADRRPPDGDAWRAGGAGGGGSGLLMLFIAGVAGASAMILPGVSGGYLLLVLGQYLPILASIERVKDGLKGGDIGAALAEWTVVAPVGLGVVAGVLGVSNLLRWLLARFEKPTLGFLLGLLIGSVIGLWPFQRGVAPSVGDMVKGAVVTPATVSDIEAEDWAVERFAPGGAQIGGSIALILLGFGVTMGIARVGKSEGGEG